MYAWSRFAKEVNEWGQVKGWILPGDKVSQSDLGVGDEEWQELQKSGVVRETPYPDIPANVAPAEYFRANPDAVPEEPVKVEEVPEPKTNENEENSGINDLFSGGGVTQ